MEVKRLISTFLAFLWLCEQRCWEELAILFCIIPSQPPGLSVKSLLSFLFLLTLHSFRWLRGDSHIGFVVSRVTWTAKFIIQRHVPKGNPPDELESACSTELPQGVWMDRHEQRGIDRKASGTLRAFEWPLLLPTAWTFCHILEKREPHHCLLGWA